MRTTFTIIIVFLGANCFSQSDTVENEEINQIMNFCHTGITIEESLKCIEGWEHFSPCRLMDIMIAYSSQEYLNLSEEKIFALERTALQIAECLYNSGKPVIFEIIEAGSDGGKMRIEKQWICDKELQLIFWAQTDLIFEFDKLQRKILALISDRSLELLKD
ncbi:MAG: hypothetical protein ABFS38_03400 [Bacteroidota bacterium]